MYHAPEKKFAHPYIVPGAGYESCLWDWDTRFASEAILAIMKLAEAPAQTHAQMISAMQGTVMNFLDFQHESGAIAHSIYQGVEHLFAETIEKYDEPNQHKPVLAQYILMISKEINSLDWIRAKLPDMERYLVHYDEKYFHEKTGLYYWRSDAVIGVDNDPCTFGRPRNSSASVYLNCLMVKEFEAMADLHDWMGNKDRAVDYRDKKEKLSMAIRTYCWDKRDRFFYSVDLLCKHDPPMPWLHGGLGVFWPCLPLRIRVWTGFMPMWAGVATQEEASVLVRLHLNDTEALASEYGIRSLAKNEPMYDCSKTGNPSNWLGPIWLIVNYITFKGLVDYGFHSEAKELCAKIINLLGRDIQENGAMHEYYVPETGKGVMNLGFMNWNYLVANMILTVQKMD